MFIPRTPHDLLFLASFILVPATLLTVTRSGLAQHLVLAGSPASVGRAIEEALEGESRSTLQASGGSPTQAQKAKNARRASVANIRTTLDGHLIGAAAVLATADDANNITQIYSYSATDAKPLASITKLMTALVALEQPGNEQITITLDMIATEGDGQLFDGEVWSKQDLVRMALLASSNDAAEALAQAYGREHFIALMNETAARHGFGSLHFSNPTGLDIDVSTPGATGSATDIAKLATYVMTTYPQTFAVTAESSRTFTSAEGRSVTFSTTNPVSRELTGLFFSKTGFTDIAGGNLVVMFDSAPGKPYVAVILGSTFDGRFSDIETMVRAAVANPL